MRLVERVGQFGIAIRMNLCSLVVLLLVVDAVAYVLDRSVESFVKVEVMLAVVVVPV